MPALISKMRPKIVDWIGPVALSTLDIKIGFAAAIAFRRFLGCSARLNHGGNNEGGSTRHAIIPL